MGHNESQVWYARLRLLLRVRVPHNLDLAFVTYYHNHRDDQARSRATGNALVREEMVATIEAASINKRALLLKDPTHQHRWIPVKLIH